MFDEPVQIYVTPGDPITVREEVLEGGLGYFDESTFEIVLDSEQPEAGKLVILLHELIHASETAMLQWGVMDERLSETAVEAMSMFLSTALARLGVVQPVDVESFETFLVNQSEEGLDVVGAVERLGVDVSIIDEDGGLLRLCDEGEAVGILSMRTSTFYPSEDIDVVDLRRFGGTLVEALQMYGVVIADVWYYHSQEYVDYGDGSS